MTGPDAPLVSIIIRNYNYEQFLGDALDSALGQDYPRVEIVVVDDGSTDGSRALLKSYGQRCRVILQPNSGEGAGVNAGFRQARGEIVIFLDSDDVLAPWAVRRDVEIWRPDIARVNYRLDEIDEQGRLVWRIVPPYVVPDLEFEEYFLRFGEMPSGNQSCNAYASRALRRFLPLDEKRWFRAPDCCLNALTSAQGRTLHIDESLGGCRQHSRNLHMRNSLDVGRNAYVLDIHPNLEKAVRDFLEPERAARFRMRYNTYHFRNRMLSLKLNRKAHPFPEDRVVKLYVACFRAVLRRPFTPVGRKIFLLGGLSFVALAPAFVVRPLYPIMLRVARHVTFSSARTHKHARTGQRRAPCHWTEAFSPSARPADR